ncbi:MAG: hypothetical protein KC448_07835 [Yoonia sp.]|nr:hypothetical protein [Yoonia sp.]
MTSDKFSSDPRSKTAGDPDNAGFVSRVEVGFVRLAAVVYAAAALAMVTISVGLISVSLVRVYAAFFHHQGAEGVLLEAVSSLVISVAILDVAKYVMEEEVLRNRELRDPSEAREAVTKFMVIIALVVAIEGIVLVFELGNSQPELLLYPILLLAISVIIVVGLGIFQRLSLQAEERLADAENEHEIR